MDTYEIIALSLVALAALLALRYFFGKKGGGCCGSDCQPKLGKKENSLKPEDKK